MACIVQRPGKLGGGGGDVAGDSTAVKTEMSSGMGLGQ